MAPTPIAECIYRVILIQVTTAAPIPIAVMGEKLD